MGVVREGEGCFWGEGREQGLRRALLSAVLVLELASFPAGLRADPSIDRVQDVGGTWISGYLPFAIGCNRPGAACQIQSPGGALGS